MTWTKHFQQLNKNQKLQNSLKKSSSLGSATAKTTSTLPEVYAGHPLRQERYEQYNLMDQDAEINAALDTICNFSTRPDEETGSYFKINFLTEPNDTEVEITKALLQQWSNLNNMRKRIWRMFRNMLKYGDQFFIRDPETMELIWIDASKVEKVVVDESKGKIPQYYVIRDLDLNLVTKVASKPDQYGQNVQGTGSSSLKTSNEFLAMNTSQTKSQSRFDQQVGVTNVDATHVVHFSLSEGLDANWPFGTSILEPLFKVFKQKELLEDSIVIYRVQRAPERRVFYLDVGGMPVHKTQAYLDKVKMEIHQRRIPTRTNSGNNINDAAYNPLCLDMNTRVPLLDGRTLSITELTEEYNQGKENWVYSCDPITGKVVPGNITWAGVTRKDAQVIKITLDNGETVILTPDHKVPVLGRGFVEAQHLTKTDSLIGHQTRYKSLSKDENRSYHQIYDHETNKWRYTHRMVAEFFRERNNHQEFTFSEELIGAEKNTVHHRDYNRYNNDPRNLTWMNDIDHRLFHSIVNQEYWDNLTPEESERIKNKIRNSLAETRANYTQEDIDAISEACRKGQIKRWAELDRTSDKYKEYTETLSKHRLRYIEENPDFLALLKINIKAQQEAPWCNVKFNWTQEMLSAFVHIVKEGNHNKESAIKAANANPEFLKMIEIANPKPKLGKFGITYDFQNSKLKTMYKAFGYKNWKDFKKKIPQYNHRITSIEWLEETIDTGCITIDSNERWHNYHTFAIESGIYVKNSILEDFFFAQTCLDLNTNIPLLDGRTLSLKDIISEYKEGKENFVYSQNTETFELEAGKIVWAGETRLNAEVYEVTLDNGEKITATPDHRFILRDGSEVEVQDLIPGMSMMPLYLHTAKTNKDQTFKKYLRYTSNVDGKRHWVHTAICPKTESGRKYEIHHVDFNSLNNNPTNLIEMTAEDHNEFHRQHGSYSLKKQWNDPVSRQKLLDGINALYANMSPEFAQALSDRNRINGSKTWENEDSANRSLASLRKSSAETSKRKKIKFTIEMFYFMEKLFEQGNYFITNLGPALQNSVEFQELVRFINPNLKRDKNNSINISVRDNTLNKLVQLVGYKTFGDWKQQKLGLKSKFSNKVQNHKIVSVIKLDSLIDTGDITIETKSGSHIFAVSAGIFVHNSEGRGSRVETLPGGENLGCFALDTKIKLLDGRDLSINDIEVELKDGKTLWTTSCHPVSGIQAPGLISWAGTTRKNSEVAKVTLNNGESFVCTWDHKFPILGVGFRELRELLVGQELIGFENPISIVKIEFLDEKMDVGTLTIDGNEEYHDYHTYALSAGVFAKNSIDDLKYFNNKLIRGLRVPSSYLPTGPDDGQASFNDGRVGTAYIQEYAFACYCERLQILFSEVIEDEFKLFIKQRGYGIDSSMFNVTLNPPQNFRQFAQIERDSASIGVFSQLTDIPYFSKRFLMQRFLGMTDEEMTKNERLWKQENPDITDPIEGEGSSAGAMGGMPGLDSVGFREQPEEMSFDGIEDNDMPEEDNVPDEPAVQDVTPDTNSTPNQGPLNL
jgi:intein/homing endonuclease